MNISDSILDLIGGTPLLRPSRFAKDMGLHAQLVVKLESFNPAGSAKDRIGVAMLREAEKEGKLQKGGVIIEPTSGNTGIGIALAARVMGYEVILTMPETMSVERRQLLSAYGAKLVLTPGALGMNGAIRKAKELAASTPNSFIPGQFENPANPRAHYLTTGPEIWRDTGGAVDFLVAGVGTGGTLTGAGKYLKEQKPSVRLVAAEPKDSPVLSGGCAGAHKLQGIGAGFIPKTTDLSLIDEIVTVETDQAVGCCRSLAEREGVLSGFSSGAALFAGCAVAQRPENEGKLVVVILPDGGEKYLSSGIFRQPAD